MNLKALSTSDWLKVGGGIGMVIFGFMAWITISVGGFGSDSGANVFDFFFTGTVPWVLVVGTAVVTVLLAGGVLKPTQAPWPLITLLATGLAAVLLLIRLVFNPIDGVGFFGGVDVGRGIGMWLSVLSGLAAAAGGVLGYTAAGGDLKSLTDVNALKSQLSNQDDSGNGTPPPPPPSSPLPPPPSPS